MADDEVADLLDAALESANKKDEALPEPKKDSEKDQKKELCRFLKAIHCPCQEGEEKKKKKSKWDEMGDPSAGLPDWLKDAELQNEMISIILNLIAALQGGPQGTLMFDQDLAKKDDQSQPAPPGIDPSRFKIIRMEGVQIRALIGKGGETIKEKTWMLH
eukprot:g23871.t1